MTHFDVGGTWVVILTVSFSSSVGVYVYEYVCTRMVHGLCACCVLTLSVCARAYG